MKKSTRTIYGVDIQNSLLTGTPYKQLPNTTLNEKFGVFQDTRPDNNTIPRLGYFAIGIGGRRPQVGEGGRVYTVYNEYAPEQAALYDHVPFIIRPVAEDLDMATRAKYAMRKVIVVGGKQYVAYYLRRIDFTSATTAIQQVTVTNGVESFAPFAPTSAVLNPVAPQVPNQGVVTTNGRYYSATKRVRLDFSATDVTEAATAIETIFGNRHLAVISEVALVAGVDKTMTVTGSSGAVNYREAISATCISHLVCDYPLIFSNRGFEFEVELGAPDPLLGVANITPGPLGP